MKIALVAYLHGAGGAERQIIMLANEMAIRGHETHLLILVDNKSTYYIHKNVVVHDLTYSELKPGNRIINRFKSLKREYYKFQPDVTVHFWLQSAFFSVLMPKMIRGKTIYAERGDPSDKEFNGIVGLERLFAFRYIDGFVFQSVSARDYFPVSITKRSTIIYNAISIPDNSFLHPSVNRKKLIVNVGRLHPQKNQKCLIDAFNYVKEDIPDYNLLIIGDGALKDELVDLVLQNNLSERIKIIPSTNQVHSILYDASLFVLSSDYEGMPNVLLEALRMGVPCITTNFRISGKQMLDDLEVRACVVDRDSAEDLAKVMKKNILDPPCFEDQQYNIDHLRIKLNPEKIYDEWEKFLSKIHNRFKVV